MQKLITPGRSIKGRRTTPDWLWALAPMLLAAAMVVPILGRDIFDVDEASVVISACARHLGPCTPAEAVRASARWPDQAWGQAIVFSQWGQLVGWSEFAMRVLPWLSGLLTLAWVYRLGRDLFTPAIALAATLLLATSVLFLTYMHIIRFYGPSMLFAAITLWGYWRVALVGKAPRRAAQATLLMGATGALYAQYFGALLVPALGLFHLFFLPRNGRWWRATIALALAVLPALPQAQDFLDGIAFNQGKEWLRDSALQAPEILSLFLRYLGSDLLNVPHDLARLLLLALPLFPLLCWWRLRSQRRRPCPAIFLAVTSALLLLLVMGANTWAQVFHPTRVRYLSALWPPAILLVSLVLLHPSRPTLRRPLGIVLVLAMALAGAGDFLQAGPLVRTSWSWRDSGSDVTLTTLKGAMRELETITTETLLFVDERLLGAKRRTEAWLSAFDRKRLASYAGQSSQTLLERTRGNHEVVLLLRSSMENDLHLQDHVEFFLQKLWIQHQAWSEGGLTLVRLVTPFSTLLVDKRPLEFGQGITMVGSGILREPDKLRFLAHFSSADDAILANYALAAHVIDPESGRRVAQKDLGVGPGSYARTVNDIDVSALAPGVYELHVALYDWQTGERLMARDLQTGAVSDMHVLQRFRIG